MNNKPKITLRKTPTQARARFTVSIILEATAHILRVEGYEQLSTNSVASKAGISIGSLYQYFPNKESLIAELRRQHFVDIRDKMGKAMIQAEGLSFEATSRLLIEASISAHQIDPMLHRVISSQTLSLGLSEDDNSESSSRKMIEKLLFKHKNVLRDNLDIPLAAHITYQLVESVTHSAVLDEPELLNHPKLVDELLHMLMVYVQQEIKGGRLD